MRPFHGISCIAVLTLVVILGCAGAQERKREPYYTSGSRDADQRAEQRMAKDRQLRADSAADAAPNSKKSLFVRLGGEQKIQAIVDDFVDRALADPRVNWERK